VVKLATSPVLGVVRRAALAVADAREPVRRQVDPPAADVGVAFHSDVLLVFWAEGGVVEGQPRDGSRGEAAAHGEEDDRDSRREAGHRRRPEDRRGLITGA
jgi:hypothetical protein